MGRFKKCIKEQDVFKEEKYSTVANACERDEKQLDYVNPVKDLDKLSNYQLLKKYLVPCA